MTSTATEIQLSKTLNASCRFKLPYQLPYNGNVLIIVFPKLPGFCELIAYNNVTLLTSMGNVILFRTL